MKTKTKLLYTILDFFIVFFAFLLAIWLKPATKRFYLPNYLEYFIIFEFIWISISVISKKYELAKRYSLARTYLNIFIINIAILASVALLMYSFRSESYSRLVVFGTVITATTIELIMASCHYFIYNTNGAQEALIAFEKYQKSTREKFIPVIEDSFPAPILTETIQENVKEAIIEESNEDVFKFIANCIDLSIKNYTIISTTTLFNILKLPEKYYLKIINLKRVNDIQFVNKFFESLNKKLLKGGTFIGCVETKNLRKKRILKKFPPVLNRIYYFFDFIVKRVFPKFHLTKKLYFFLTRGQNRVLSKAETFGRLYSCGFNVINEKEINGLLYYVARKTGEPYFDMDPTYGPLIKLHRIGKQGKIIHVYKFRTMHPYAEYLQEYIYKKNNIQKGGKFNNDFRVTTIGKIFRKYWLDELPMLINLFKGDMKIVGVRPLSEHYFSLYSKELQEKRIKIKPGLIPPFYADLPKSLEEIQVSELKYLESYSKNWLLTDWRYFWKAIFNIVFRKARSN